MEAREEFVNLCKLAMEDLSAAIGYCEMIMSEEYETFEEFLDSLRTGARQCDQLWDTPRLVVSCENCAKGPDWTMCLSCYRKSNHQDHNVRLKMSNFGMCGCSNICAWKTGCHDHIMTSDEDRDSECDLDSEKRIFYISLFIALQSNANFLVTFEPEKFIELCNWFSKLAKTGWKMRQCVSIAWSHETSFRDLLRNIDSYRPDVIEHLTGFIRSLLCDDGFTIKFAMNVFRLQSFYASLYVRHARNGLDSTYMNPLIDLSSYMYTSVIMDTTLSYTEWSWTNDVIDFFNVFSDVILDDPSGGLLMKSNLDKIGDNIIRMLKHMVTLREQVASVQVVFDSITNVFEKLEALKRFPLLLESERTDFAGLFVASSFMSKVAEVFVNSRYVLRCNAAFSAIVRFIAKNHMIDKFDIDRKVLSFQRSLYKTALFTPIMPCHLMFGAALAMHRSEMINFIQLFVESSISVTDLCRFVAVLPMRWLGVTYLAQLKCIPVASRAIRYLAKKMTLPETTIQCFVPLFVLLQTLFGLMTKKDPFIYEMAHNYGLFGEFEDVGIAKKMMFAFFLMLTCLLTDTDCYNRDYASMRRMSIRALLCWKPMTTNELAKMIPNDIMDERLFFQEVSDCATRARNDTPWKVKDNTGWNAFLPWLHPAIAMNSLAAFQDNHPKQLCPFPNIRQASDGMTFSTALSCPVLLALMYYVLRNSVTNRDFMSTECVQIILNLMILRCKNNGIHEKQTIAPLKIKTHAELVDYIQDLVLIRVLWTPYELVNEAHSAPMTFVDVIEQVGEIGKVCLDRMNIGYTRDTREDLKDERAKRWKRQISEEFKARQAMFEATVGDLSDEPEEEALCHVCNTPASENTVLSFPTVLYKSLNTLCFRICCHTVHTKCVQMHNDQFTCPIDRERRTLLMPNFSELETPLTKEHIIQLREFNTALAKMIPDVHTVEIIFRALVHALGRAGSKIRTHKKLLIRNLYKILRHMKHILHWSFNFAHLSPIDHFIQQIIDDDNPKERITSIIASLSCYESEFMKSVALFDVVVFENEEFVINDFIFSPEKMSERYSLDREIVVCCRKEIFVDLPEQWIDLAFPPYNLPIEDVATPHSLCLLTGRVLPIDSNGTRKVMQRHIDSECSGSATCLLVLTGPQASSVLLVSDTSRLLKVLPSVYTDETGDEDIGLACGRFLRLNRSRLQEYTELIVSGNWTDYDVM